MRKLLIILFLFPLQLLAQRDVNIDALIKNMSIEEKVGQMTQLDLGVLADGKICALKKPQTLNKQKLEKAFKKYQIGSILNVGCGSGTISMERWHSIIDDIQDIALRNSKNKIPVLYGIDAIHGVTYTKGGTLFPQQIGQAATWNPKLVKRANQISAYETRASGIPWNFSPVLDVARQPLWSRFFETYGEDVYLAKTMAQHAIEGLQNNKEEYRVAACMKHFLGYSLPLTGKDRTPAWISERELREYFLPTFQTAIVSGAKTVMINSGDINGTPVHANQDILTKLLRDELKFEGVAVTDWEDIYKLHTLHRVASSKREATKMAILAGIDMSMTPNDYEFTDHLIDLVKKGEISEERINLSVRRILTLKKELGLFETSRFNKNNYPDFGSKKFATAAYNAATESITLLKNKNNLLPLKNSKKILVCGAASNSLDLLNGAWTHTWLGQNEKDQNYITPNKKTIARAINDAVGHDNFFFAKGASVTEKPNMEKTFVLANQADYIIICLGETPATEIPGNINTLDLEKAQQQLVEDLSITGKPIILVLCFNRPKIIHSLIDKVDAIVHAYLPGNEGGRAVSDILFGKVNPSGKLPFTYPSATNSLVTYDHKRTEDMHVDFSMKAFQPDFEFGEGRSYSRFSYGALTVSKKKLGDNESIDVQISVKNTSQREGKEVVQLYYDDLFASITPAVKKLVRYQKIHLKPSEEKIVRFELSKEDFSFISKDLKRITEEGDIILMCKDKKQKIEIR